MGVSFMQSGKSVSRSDFLKSNAASVTAEPELYDYNVSTGKYHCLNPKCRYTGAEVTGNTLREINEISGGGAVPCSWCKPPALNTLEGE